MASERPESGLLWIPIESNPDVFNEWARKAGLNLAEAHFEDVYGLDPEAQLLALVPQPVKAIVVLFPMTEAIRAISDRDDDRHRAGALYPVDPNVIYIRQTIGNACGTMAILHSLLNTDVSLAPNSALAILKEQCKGGKTPEERAKVLETTTAFADIHAEAAVSGQSTVPDNLTETGQHYTCFLQAPDPRSPQEMRLLELEARRPGVVDRGASVSLLEDVAKFVKEQYVAQNPSAKFSMIALVPLA
ncbi:cysteine proteinase [Wolfiporia cocos MD-104 SS10]|uniref:Ubiquitin carboxyl-terminal hydrolase n=1 Tax=Wolfiporia cocos (strain MD-104) TaxID=742152 RepID=A0A2H3JQG1_WOLCO|nr:cysteine proteinase [Wolfiporia cocos MD-104 SS10]